MEKITENTQTKTPTRAEKREAAKELIRELLRKTDYKSNDLIDEAARLFTDRFGSGDAENPNDVKGRIGSVLDMMKKEGEVKFDGGMYSTTEEKPAAAETAPAPKKRGRKKKEVAETAALPETTETPMEETPEKKKRAPRKTAKKKEADPLPAAPIQPIAPVVPVTPTTAPEPMPEDKPAPKKRGRAKKVAAEQQTEVKKEEVKEEVKEIKEEVAAPIAPPAPKTELVVKEKAEIAPKGTLMDMSFLFGDIKPVKKEQPKAERKEERKEERPAPQVQPKESKEPVKEQPKEPVKEQIKTKPAEQTRPVQTERRPAPVKTAQPRPAARTAQKRGTRALTPDEKLQEAFLTRLHKLGGEYFEYYSIYLLERYSRMNGRRLEGLKVTGGDHDGGIDGEIELTDKLGFRETIYIQAKNWDPDKGDEKLWVVGETLLQQFIGACVCRQAKDGKQHCRGIFITTSRFTPEAKKLLDDTSDKFVGYDGTELFETAKECGFGIVKKNGEWSLDETLLSGTKAFFNMY